MNNQQNKRLSEAQTGHIAHLARLELAPEDIEKYVGDLNNILDYVARLREIDTENVDPTFQTAPLANVFREDEATDSLATNKALSNAPRKDEFYFLTPGIMSKK